MEIALCSISFRYQTKHFLASCKLHRGLKTHDFPLVPSGTQELQQQHRFAHPRAFPLHPLCHPIDTQLLQPTPFMTNGTFLVGKVCALVYTCIHTPWHSLDSSSICGIKDDIMMKNYLKILFGMWLWKIMELWSRDSQGLEQRCPTYWPNVIILPLSSPDVCTLTGSEVGRHGKCRILQIGKNSYPHLL